MASVVVTVEDGGMADDGNQALSSSSSGGAAAAGNGQRMVSASDAKGNGGNGSRRTVKTKGRGFKSTGDNENRYAGKGGEFDSLDEAAEASKSIAQRSVEGWIVFVSNVHEESQEDDLYDLFADYGDIKQIHLNLDRRTGYVKGYALIEYEHFKEAQAAIDGLNGATLLEHKLGVDWAFKKPPHAGGGGGGGGGGGARRQVRRNRT